MLQINTPVVMGAQGPNSTLDEELGDYIDAKIRLSPFPPPTYLYLLGIWRVSPAGLEKSISVLDPESEEGASPMASPFCIAEYAVRPEWGGEESLRKLRVHLEEQWGAKLMLDFVPNHLAVDHDLTLSHPSLFVNGDRGGLEAHPGNYFETRKDGDVVVLAHGRDPHFDGWEDTVQLDYSNPETVEMMGSILESIACMADAVRVDMAMLVLPRIFEKTWGKSIDEDLDFWPVAIPRAKACNPDFVLVAEAYWDTEGELQELGFDYTYDKRLYDRLKEADGDAGAVRGHLRAELGFQSRSVRFLENHDEERAMSAFPGGRDRMLGLATVVSSVPGLLFLYDGQMEGATRHQSMHSFAPMSEPVDYSILAVWQTLLSSPLACAMDDGSVEWRGVLDTSPSNDGDPSFSSIVALQWNIGTSPAFVVVVNLSDAPCTGHVHVDVEGGEEWYLRDVLCPVIGYCRALGGGGLWVGMEGYGVHLFGVQPVRTAGGAA